MGTASTAAPTVLGAIHFASVKFMVPNGFTASWCLCLKGVCARRRGVHLMAPSQGWAPQVKKGWYEQSAWTQQWNADTDRAVV